jgi:cobalt-zinc-cadmium efflux system membrane fusion protein
MLLSIYLYAASKAHTHGKAPCSDHTENEKVIPDKAPDKKYDQEHKNEIKDQKKQNCEDHDHDKKIERQVNHDEHDGHEHSNEEHNKENDLLVLTPEQKKNVEIKTSKAIAGDINSQIFLLGEIKYNRDRMAQIMPQMPGFVSKIYNKIGDKVKAGKTLAILQSHKLGELYAEYHSAKELELLAKTEFEIKARLWEKRAASEREFIQARQKYAESIVKRHRAEDKLKSLGLEPDSKKHSPHDSDTNCTNYHLKSPIDGVVISKNITIGENYPEDNEKIPFIVADLSELWADFSARQYHLPKLKTGMPVTVKLGEGFPDFTGKISYIGTNFATETRTVLVRVILENTQEILKPGLFAKGIISLHDPKSKKIVVPRSAVLIIEGEKIIFIPERSAYKALPVKTGKSSGDHIEIISGLKPGDKYVSEGAFELKALMITKGMDPHAGHGH